MSFPAMFPKSWRCRGGYTKNASLVGSIFLGEAHFYVSETKIHTARLVHAAPLSSQARHMEFEVQSGGFDFQPGQFLSFLAFQDGREITHPYSIASAPRQSRFDLCLNRVDDS